MKNGVNTVTLDQLIEAALKGQPNRNHERFGKETKRYAMAIARAKAPDLSEDLHEEIAQQAVVELFQFGAKALAKTTGKALFRKAVFNAVRVVRATNAPPGERTRHQKITAAPLTAADVASARIDQRRVRRAGDTGSGDPPAVLENLPDPHQQAAFAQIDNVIYVSSLLLHAPAPVERALRLIHFKDFAVEAAAENLDITRFALNRRLKAFYQGVRTAA
ncbi:hypothetical protein [uncultured Brevundimonas sp.]|uniref:hypothetical protein n=1 Tax=uncultured Brevundimonas sp. TaxID=213418 RepID=UPI0025CC8602|nr:hypothetical protein [uncultured Brevundimonas sp.]